MDGCFANDNAGTLVDNALGGIEHTHDDIPCVADYEDGKGRLENPAEEHGSIEVVHCAKSKHTRNEVLDALKAVPGGTMKTLDGCNALIAQIQEWSK